MDARWERIVEVFSDASELPPAERPAFLDRVCAGDPGLRREVESMLASDSEAEGFLDIPVAKVAPPAERLAEGARIGPYEVVSLVGSGGMGEVYRARDTRLDRSVAIKVLPREMTADVDRKRRLLREARAASALNTPHIVTIHDVVSENGRDSIVMEFVHGRTLADLIERKALRHSDAIKYAMQIADALAAAHAAGVVHRDVKPGNIMITRDDQVKVLDFGLAKQTGLRPDEPVSMTAARNRD